MSEIKNACFGTVVYDRAFPFLEDFLLSIDRQTMNSIRLIIINDNCDPKELKKRVYTILPKHRCEIIDIGYTMSPSELRIVLMKYAKTMGIDLLILGDCDDFFSHDRAEACIKVAQENKSFSFFYNEIVDQFGKAVMSPLPDKVKSINCVLEYNFLGLSNTAIRVDRLNEVFLDSMLADKTNIFDWYFFSRMLIDGYTGKKCKKGMTYYRIHDNNIAGIMENTKANRRKEIKVKIEHYHFLSKFAPAFQELYTAYLNFEEECEECDGENSYWWSLMRRKSNEF